MYFSCKTKPSVNQSATVFNKYLVNSNIKFIFKTYEKIRVNTQHIGPSAACELSKKKNSSVNSVFYERSIQVQGHHVYNSTEASS